MTSPLKPLVLISAVPAHGHLMPLKAIGTDLVRRGYEVAFVTGSAYRQGIEKAGATLIPLTGDSDFTENNVDAIWPQRKEIPAGFDRLIFDMKNIFIGSIKEQHEAQQRALKLLNDKHPGRPIVMVNESGFAGATALLAGAPGLRPFGPGLPPDNSPEGRIRQRAMTRDMQENLFRGVQQTYEAILTDLGATGEKIPFFFDSPYLLSDHFLQMCIPSVEYPRTDAPSSLRFIGGLPKGHRDAFVNPPSWWGEVTSKTKKIVGVSQGTVAIDFLDLIIPTMMALKDRDDVLVVVALGRKGAVLPPSTLVPSNARVADFIPYDDLLPHCALFITNGGYGGFQHAIGHGTPIVVAGTTEDKGEVAARAEWAGLGLNLKTDRPTTEALSKAVKEVLSNPKYKKRALELKAEAANYDPFSIIAKTIEELASGK